MGLTTPTAHTRRVWDVQQKKEQFMALPIVESRCFPCFVFSLPLCQAVQSIEEESSRLGHDWGHDVVSYRQVAFHGPHAQV